MLITTINSCLSLVSKSQLSRWFKNDYLSTIFLLEVFLNCGLEKEIKNENNNKLYCSLVKINISEN